MYLVGGCEFRLTERLLIAPNRVNACRMGGHRTVDCAMGGKRTAGQLPTAGSPAGATSSLRRWSSCC